MRTFLIGGTVTTLLLVIVLVGYGLYDQKVLQPELPVATVDGTTITSHDFLSRYRLRRVDLQNQLASAQQMLDLFAGNPQFETYLQQQVAQINSQLANPLSLGQQVLDELIEDVLISGELGQRAEPITEAEVDREIEQSFGFGPTPTPVASPTGAAPTQSPTVAPTSTATALPTGTPAASATPAPTATPYTREAFEADYVANLQAFDAIGVREQDYRSRVRARLARERLRDILGQDIPKTEEQVWAEHILLGDEDRAVFVLSLYEEGQDWDALAAEFSMDAGNRNQGGDLGWFPRGTMVSRFEEVAFAAPVGSVVGPFHTPFGWHLVRVLGHEDHPLESSVLSQRVDSALRDWILQARASASIQVEGRWADLVGSSG